MLSLSQDGGKEESVGDDASDTMSQSSTHTQEEKVTSTTKDTPTKESGHRGEPQWTVAMVTMTSLFKQGIRKRN